MGTSLIDIYILISYILYSFIFHELSHQIAIFHDFNHVKPSTIPLRVRFVLPVLKRNRQTIDDTLQAGSMGRPREVLRVLPRQVLRVIPVSGL